MSNLITQEKKLSEKYMLTTIDFEGTKLVEISIENVAKVESMIMTDSSYYKMFDKNAMPYKKYNGSTAYWLTELKKILILNEISKYSYNDIIFNLVKAIDRENRTHINSDKQGIGEITERIKKISKEKLLTFLRRPREDNYKLVSIIAEKTNPKGENKQGKSYKGRENVSFATKFCHYCCYFLFEGEQEQDNYPIKDSVISGIIPLYLKYYNLNTKIQDITTYNNFCIAIESIISASNIKISKNGLDHLLWYYYKGRFDMLE